jgi:hypothetical protein
MSEYTAKIYKSLERKIIYLLSFNGSEIMKFTHQVILSFCLAPTLMLSACSNAGASSTIPLPCDSSLVINTSSNTISSVESYAQQLNCPVPSVNVCTAFDIDNTLITNEPNLGGEAWGNWQEYLTESDHNSPYLATNWLSNVGVYQAQSGIRFLINFKPVESITAASIASLQAKYQTIAISSRGFSSLATTTRQLAANMHHTTKTGQIEIRM